MRPQRVQWADFVNCEPQDLYLYMEDVDAIIEKGRKAGVLTLLRP